MSAGDSVAMPAFSSGGSGYVYGASKGAPSPTRATGAAPAAPLSRTVRRIRVNLIDLNPDNPRGDVGDVTEMAESIRAHGLIQEITVEARGGRYVLIAGERRLAAVRAAGLESVDAYVRPGRSGGAQSIVLAMIENGHRKDLTVVEKAEGFGRLRDEYGWSPAKISAETGFSPSTVSRSLAFLELDNETRERVRSGTVKVGDALEAVKDARAMQRSQPARRPANGQPVKPRPAVKPVRLEPPHFTFDHPVAPAAQLLCDHQGLRPLLAGVCQKCWEQAIRADERTRRNGAS